LTGGEPLLHPAIHDILEEIRRHDLWLTVETNGVLCTPEIAREIAACKNPHVSVSLDSAEAEIHEWMRGVKGCFEAALGGLRALTEAGFKPQIIMSVVRRNRDQMEPMVRLAESVGASSVKFNIVQPTARGRKMREDGETLTIEELLESGRWVENDLSARTDLQIFYSHPMAFRSLGRLFGQNAVGCGLCGIKSILGVLADGSYALCGIGETVPDLVFGHAVSDSLEDVWNSNPVLGEIREGLPDRLEGICADCILKGICFGSCIAQNYYISKNLWAPNWYCEEAHRIGEFPETRLRSRFSEEVAAESGERR
jgi:SynChlorMet cassette radical SAM/SPASM protein ScmF